MYGLTQISLLAVDRELATNRKTLFILVTVPPAHQKPKIEVGFFAFFLSGTPTRIFSYCRGRVLISEQSDHATFECPLDRYASLACGGRPSPIFTRSSALR